MSFEEDVKKNSAAIIEQLISEALAETYLEVLFDYEAQDQWSFITTHHYEEDKEISLRLHSTNVFKLIIGYYDDEDEFHEVIHELNADEQTAIPDGLQKLMQKVMNDEQSIKVATNLLKGKI